MNNKPFLRNLDRGRGLLWALKRLFGLSGPLISLGMLAFVLGEMLASTHTRSIFQDDLSVYPWVLSPYLAVGLVGYRVRSDPALAALTFLAAIVSTALGFYLLYPYLLHGDNVGKGMAAGLVPLLQWQVLVVFAVLGLIYVLLRKLLKPSDKPTSRA